MLLDAFENATENLPVVFSYEMTNYGCVFGVKCAIANNDWEKIPLRRIYSWFPRS